MAVRSKIDKVVMTIFKSRPYITNLYIPLTGKMMNAEEYPHISKLHNRMMIIATRHEDSIVWYYSRCFDTRLKGDKTVGNGYIPLQANSYPNIKEVILNSIKVNDYYVDYAYGVKIYSPNRFFINADFMLPLGMFGAVNYSDMEEISSYTLFKEYVGGDVQVAENLVDSIESAYWVFDSYKTSPLTISEYDKLKDKEPHTKARNMVITMKANLAKLRKEAQMFVPTNAKQQKLI